MGIIPCLILLGKLYHSSWEEVGEECVEVLRSAVGQAWDGAPESMNTMPLSVEHDGLGRSCSPVTAAWTMRAPNPGTPGVNMEGVAPCSSIPTMCAAGSTIHAQERLWMEMCCIWNLLPSSAEGLQEAQSQESCE